MAALLQAPGVLVRCCNSTEPPKSSGSSSSSSSSKSVRRAVDSTDWVATSLTRRFGFGAGLAWVGFLAFGVVSEQIKTRFEVSSEQRGTREVQQQEEVRLEDGLRVTDLVIGGGAAPRPGDLVALQLLGRYGKDDDAKVFIDTAARRRPLVFVLGAKPYAGGVCRGLAEAISSMRAGGRRRVVVPPQLGFGDEGTVLQDGSRVSPNTQLEYIVQLLQVSISPS